MITHPVYTASLKLSYDCLLAGWGNEIGHVVKGLFTLEVHWKCIHEVKIQVWTALLYLRIEHPAIPHSMAMKVHGCSLSVCCKFKGIQRLATGRSFGRDKGENLWGGDVLPDVNYAGTRGWGHVPQIKIDAKILNFRNHTLQLGIALQHVLMGSGPNVVRFL